MESVEGKAEKNDLSNIYIKECRVTQKKERTKRLTKTLFSYS